MQVQPYLFFDGRCDEALEFYKRALGAEVLTLMRFKDGPEQPKGDASCPTPPGDKVMHGSFRLGETTILVSDGNAEGNPSFKGFSLTLTVSEVGEAEKLFKAVSEGGQVQMPLTKTFFSPSFGMAADRFGVSWMIYVERK